MNTATFPCDDCNSFGEFSSGHICTTCAGTGSRLCDFCRRLPATDVVDRENGSGTAVCSECYPITVSDVCWCCLAEPPIVMHGGLAVCADCWDSARRSTTRPPPRAPITERCLVQCDQAAAETLPETYAEAANDSGAAHVVDEDEELRLGQLQASALLIEDARAVGWEPREAFRAVRRGLIAKGG